MREFIEEYPTKIKDENYTLLPRQHLQIKGLKLFGHTEIERAKMPTEEHFHRECMEFSVIVKGNQTFLVGNEEFSLTGGDVFVTMASEPHRSGSTCQETCEQLWFQLDLSDSDGFLQLAPPWDRQMIEKLKDWKSRRVYMSKESIYRLRRGFHYLDSAEPDDLEKRFTGYGIFMEFLGELLLAQNNKKKTSGDMQKVLAYIDAHLGEKVDLNEAAATAGYSASWMKNNFRDQVGMPPREYVNKRKIEKAKRLLAQTEMPVTEISECLGFSGSNYFSVLFRQFAGCSPSEYRRKAYRKNGGVAANVE